MLNNIAEAADLKGLARAKNGNFITKTIKNALLSEAESDGWIVVKKNKDTVRIKKEKTHFDKLEDRVWLLLYRMGFSQLPNEKRATLVIKPKAEDGPTTKIDVVGIDEELALAVECKSQLTPKKKPEFQEELGKFALIRQNFANAVNTQYQKETKRQVVLAMFLSNIILTDKDKQRASEAKVVIFDDKDLDYYERLVKHSGVVAKYQLFADMLPGKTISGLEMCVPAIKMKMGGNNCYLFCISPSYLLKVAYVSHRSKGKGADIDTYQRMVRKSRLNKIKEYISDGGIFPTNIVINLDKKRLDFQRSHQETQSELSQDKAIFGWLNIRPAYKSAWIIDGQHRLYAYSGHEKATKDILPVLAFDGLKASEQANLFVEINSKQKAVKQSLLNELFAELKWDSEDPHERVAAIISKAFQQLNSDPESALYKRVIPVDSEKDAMCCISLTSLCSAAEKGNFYIHRIKQGSIVEFGPLWQGNSETTLNRTIYIFKNWLNIISQRSSVWWGKGSGEGGGLSMNDGVMTLIRVLGSVFQYLETKVIKSISLDNEDLLEHLKPYAEALGDYLNSLSEEKRSEFRKFRAEQGINRRMMWCQKGIRDHIQEFNPPGLDKFLEEEKAQTNLSAETIIHEIERLLQNVVIEELKREFGASENRWWIEGIPKPIRTEATKKWEDNDRKRPGAWHHLDFIDYRKIIQNNWSIFERYFGYPAKGNKEKRTKWIVDVNEIRNVVSHVSSGESVSIEQLRQLEQYRDWLNRNTSLDSEEPKENENLTETNQDVENSQADAK